MADIKSPKSGYDHPEKEEYRNRVWESLSPAAIRSIRKDENAVVVLMPSMEGLEIKTAISHGIPEEKIVCVDSSPAKIATSLWRKEHPKCKFYGQMISEAAHRIKKDGMNVCAANLDFCSNFSALLIDETIEFVRAHKSSLKRFSVTISKGREGPALVEMVKRFGPDGASSINDARMASLVSILGELCGEFSSVLSQGTYRISKTQMVWACIDRGIEAELNIKKVANEFLVEVERAYMAAKKVRENPDRVAKKMHDKALRNGCIDVVDISMQSHNKRLSVIEKSLWSIEQNFFDVSKVIVGNPIFKELSSRKSSMIFSGLQLDRGVRNINLSRRRGSITVNPNKRIPF